uniref:Something about silencing protein 10 n=1 Tax=Phallusia mammillata TaxID=59560 RepID=A0A6F9DWR5_9ASCI|nr:something about silencing protein 10 [Phallusia mammillata]
MARGRKKSETTKPMKRKGESLDINFTKEEPDPNEDEFYYDEVDQFHNKREKELLGDDDSDLSFNDDDNEEEVLGFSDEEEFEEDNDADDEEEQLIDGIPSNKAWGRKKSSYYGAESLEGLQGLDRDEVQDEEEQEALRIQQKLMEEIDEDQLDIFAMKPMQPEVDVKDTSTKDITIDVSELSVKAQWKLLKQEAPELRDIIIDFKEKSSELTTHLQPLLDLVKQNQISGKGADYVKARYRLALMYLMNISFYMALKSKRLSVHNHPIIRRLVEYRTLINRLQPLDEKLSTEVEELLLDNNYNQSASQDDSESESDEEVPDDERSEKERNEQQRQTNVNRSDAINYYTNLERKRKIDAAAKTENLPMEENLDEQNTEEDERRAISYSMNKNEGLKGKKRKIDRNPRVKHRERFRKAAIKRKSQVRVYKPEIQKYGGEVSGIRAGLVRSVKIK